MWIARDYDSTLVMFNDKPVWDDYYGFWCKDGEVPYYGNDEGTCEMWRAQRFELIGEEYEEMFKNLKWNDEPVKVNMILELLKS